MKLPADNMLWNENPKTDWLGKLPRIKPPHPTNNTLGKLGKCYTTGGHHDSTGAHKDRRTSSASNRFGNRVMLTKVFSGDGYFHRVSLCNLWRGFQVVIILALSLVAGCATKPAVKSLPIPPTIQPGKKANTTRLISLTNAILIVELKSTSDMTNWTSLTNWFYPLEPTKQMEFFRIETK